MLFIMFCHSVWYSRYVTGVGTYFWNTWNNDLRLFSVRAAWCRLQVVQILLLMLVSVLLWQGEDEFYLSVFVCEILKWSIGEDANMYGPKVQGYVMKRHKLFVQYFVILLLQTMQKRNCLRFSWRAMLTRHADVVEVFVAIHEILPANILCLLIYSFVKSRLTSVLVMLADWMVNLPFVSGYVIFEQTIIALSWIAPNHLKTVGRCWSKRNSNLFSMAVSQLRRDSEMEMSVWSVQRRMAIIFVELKRRDWS